MRGVFLSISSRETGPDLLIDRCLIYWSILDAWSGDRDILGDVGNFSVAAYRVIVLYVGTPLYEPFGTVMSFLVISLSSSALPVAA